MWACSLSSIHLPAWLSPNNSMSHPLRVRPSPLPNPKWAA